MIADTTMHPNLSAVDYICLLLYLGATLGIGFWVGRSLKSDRDYFLAGRRLPWWAIGFSLVATDIGVTDVVGVGGQAYRYGLALGNFEWIGCVPAMIVAAFVFIPHFWRLGIATVPEFMERRFNSRVRSALALGWFLFMACNLGIMLFAAGKVVKELVGWDPAYSMPTIAVLVAIYTIAGGLAAVVYSDVLQVAVMMGGCLLVVVYGVAEAGGVGPLFAQLGSADHGRLILPVDTKSPFPWTGIFFGLALVLSPAYWIGNQAIVQRAFGARSEFEAKAGYIWGALLKNFIPFLIVIPGLIAATKLPPLHDVDQALPLLVSKILPVGIRGVFLAAFLAALMSSVDSYLNSASTVLTEDLYKRFLHPNAGARHLLWVGRLTTLGLTVWGVAFAFCLMGVPEGVYSIFQTLLAFLQGPTLALLLTGLLWRRATGPAALAGFVIGVLVAVTLFTLNLQAVYKLLGWQPLFRIPQPYLYFSIWSFLAALTVVVVGSWLTRPEPEDKTRNVITFSRRGEVRP